LKIFFVSDIHGSVKCFRKLVNAGKFYGADVLIMGGDLAGKQLAFRGHDEIRPYLQMYYQALPDITFEPLRLVVSGPTAAVEWAQPSVIAAPFDGTPSVGTKVFLRAVDIFHISGGLVQHESSWCGDGWLRQRLDPGGGPPPVPLPLTPPQVSKGAMF
jgi:hypothetical protein